MRYFACVVVFFSFYISALYGQQNLVLNPSFEDVNEDQLQCRSYFFQTDFENAINNWKSASLTSDIFHMNLLENCTYNPLFSQVTGRYQLPRTGNSMVGFTNYFNPLILDPSVFFPLEMIEGQLSSPLIVGNTYRIRFYVLLSDSSDTAINNFGIKFFENSYIERTVPVTRGDVDANYTEVITDKQNWRLVELEFTPQTSNLQYFIIGNFFYSSDTMAQLVLPVGSSSMSYYFIDDVSVVNMSNLEFDELGPFCQGFSFSLPTQTMNGDTGDWSPAINNQETTTYTFTPHNPDIDPITLTIEIIEPYIEPIFDLATELCEGSSLVLPSISTNGIAGTWSPQVNNQETTVYTFTPEVGSCGLATTVTIEIMNKIQPEFDLPSIICAGTLIVLPSISENGIAGTWSPAINNQETTTYTFTPEIDSCALATSITIEIANQIQPEFDIPSIVCKGTSIVLPHISENGITGTWSPEINNQKTTTYTFTFTPEVGSCALETSITIEVVDILTPEFTLPSFICEGSVLVLPNVSNNGISGTWTPAVDNQQTTTYTFTPVGHDCAIPVTATVEVERIDTPLLNSYCTKNELYVEVIHPDLEHQFQWQINGIAIDESLPTIQLSKYANLLHENQNKVTVSTTNTSGCVTTNIIEIKDKNLCIIPRGISPQGDGVNDTFDLSHFGGVSLQIFNRYGMKVYEKKNYTNQWRGQMNSSNTLLPSGTYFYQIVTNRGETHTGWVQLTY